MLQDGLTEGVLRVRRGGVKKVGSGRARNDQVEKENSSCGRKGGSRGASRAGVAWLGIEGAE